MLVTLISVYTVHCLNKFYITLAPFHHKPFSTNCPYVCQTMSVIYCRLCDKSSTTDVTSEAFTIYPFGLSQSPVCFVRVSASHIFFLCRVLLIIVCPLSFCHSFVCIASQYPVFAL